MPQQSGAGRKEVGNNVDRCSIFECERRLGHPGRHVNINGRAISGAHKDEAHGCPCEEIREAARAKGLRETCDGTIRLKSGRVVNKRVTRQLLGLA